MDELKLVNGILHFSGRLDFKTVADLDEQVSELLRKEQPVTLDLSEVIFIDSAGVAFLESLQDRIKSYSSVVFLQGASDDVRAVLKTFSALEIPPEPEVRKIGYFEQSGADVINFLQAFYQVLIMAADVFYCALLGLVSSKGQRRGSFAQQGLQLGFQALPVVSLLSLIIGFIIALQSAIQLRIYGGNIFLADLMSVSMVRELGPLMTAVIVSGRSGSAIASEIASMQVSEEIDALRMMAINPIRYVVVPKFHALTIMLPILVFFSILVSMLGGLGIAMSYLDLSPHTYLTRAIEVLSMKDIIITFSKSAFFAWLIVIIASHFGFSARGGAEDVGKATTNSVVASIISVIFFDALFSLLYI